MVRLHQRYLEIDTELKSLIVCFIPTEKKLILLFCSIYQNILWLYLVPQLIPTVYTNHKRCENICLWNEDTMKCLLVILMLVLSVCFSGVHSAQQQNSHAHGVSKTMTAHTTRKKLVKITNTSTGKML